jgi:hypothetical protein
MDYSKVPDEPPRQAEVRTAKSSGDELEKFLDDLLPQSSPAAPGAASGAAPSLSIGQVKQLTIPAGWVEGPQKKSSGGSGHFREFHPPDSPEVKLCFYYRGRRLSVRDGAAFNAVLAAQPHVLSSDEAKSIARVLRDRSSAEDFQRRILKTEILNGRSLLVIEGTFPGIEQEQYGMCIDADGSGEAVQEIFYQAPVIQYRQYYRQAMTAIHSIVWRL